MTYLTSRLVKEMRLWLTGSQGHVWLTDNPKKSLWVCPAERGFSTQGGASWRLPGYTKRLESIASSSKRKTSVLISLPPGAQLEFSQGRRMENTKMRCRALRALKCQIKRIHDDPCKSWDPCVWADNLHRTQERICESTVSSSGRAIGSLAGAAMGQVGCFPLLSLPKTAAQCHTYTHHHTPTQTQTQNDTDTYTHT